MTSPKENLQTLAQSDLPDDLKRPVRTRRPKTMSDLKKFCEEGPKFLLNIVLV